MKEPMTQCLEHVTTSEARDYLAFEGGDELRAAVLLARHRRALDHSMGTPDEAEIHHALFLLRRACGLSAPSFDTMHVELRARLAA